MACDDFQRRIAQVGGADVLPADVAAHIAECESCAQAVAAERHVRAVLAAAAWPDSPLAHDLGRLRDRAAARQLALAGERRVRMTRWGGVALALGGAVALGVGAVRLLRPGDGAGDANLVRLLVVAALATGGAAWVGLDAAGRRLAAGGASARAQLGLSAARAVLAAGLVLGLLHPTAQGALQSVLWSASGRPASAGMGAFEASLLCAGIGDGRLRLVAASEGCGTYEREVLTGGGTLAGLGGGGAAEAGMEVRAGLATIRVGFNFTSVNFSTPMPNAGYHVVLSPRGWGRALVADEACRFPIVGGKTTTGFTLGVERCWFEGGNPPPDPLKTDLTFDWIAIEPR